MDFVRIGLLAPLLALAVGCAAPTPSSAAEVAAPALEVSVVADGLNDVWDVAVLPDGRALVTERDGRIALLSGTRAGATSLRSTPTSPTCTPAARAA